MSSQSAIKQFGKHDFTRLIEMGSDYVLKIEDIKNEELQKAAEILKILIRTDRLYLMDKETGIPWAASVVIGYDNGKLLIAHER